MYDFNKKYTLKHFLFFLFSGLSAGEICTLIPLLLVRIYFIKTQNNTDSKSRTYNHLTLLGSVIFCTILNVYAYLTNTYSIWTQGESGLQAKIELAKHFFPNRFFYTFFNRMFLIPIFGDHITFYINQRWQSVLWIGFGFIILFSYFIYKTWSKKLYSIIFSGIFTYIILIFMTCLVRKGTWNTAWFGLVNELDLFQSRYFFILTPIAILSIYSILFMYLTKTVQKKYAYAVIFALFLNFVFQNRYNFFVPPYNNNSSFESWKNTAKEIKDVRETKVTGQVRVTQGNSDFVIDLK